MLSSKKGVVGFGAILIILLIIVALFVFAWSMSVWRVAGILLILFAGMNLAGFGPKVNMKYLFILIIVAVVLLFIPSVGGIFETPLSVVLS